MEAQIVVPVTTAQGGGLEVAELPGFGPVLPSTAQDLLDTCDAVRRIAVDADSGQVLVVDDVVSTGRAGLEPAWRQPADGSAGGRGDLPVELPGGGRVDPVTGELFAREPVTALADPATDPATDPAGGWVCAPRLRSVLVRMRTDPIRVPDLATGAYRPSGRLIRLAAARDQTCTFPGCHRRVTDRDHRLPWPLGPTSAANMGCLCRHHHRAKHTSFTVTLGPDGVLTWTTRGGQRHLRRPKGH